MTSKRPNVRPIIGVVSAICAVILLGACASLKTKEKAVFGLGASETALAATQDAERALCSPTADKSAPIRHCDGPSAATIGLTDARHQELAKLFSKAFDAHDKATIALKAWKAGAPPPATVTEYQSVVTQILTLIGQLLPKTAATTQNAQRAVDETAALIQILGGK